VSGEADDGAGAERGEADAGAGVERGAADAGVGAERGAAEAEAGAERWRRLRRLPRIGELPYPWPVAEAVRLGEHASQRRFYRLTPVSRETATSPEVAASPETHTSPKNSAAPEALALPETSAAPGAPASPEIHTSPETSAAPEAPASPGALASPGTAPASLVLVVYEDDDAEAVARYERVAAWFVAAGVRVPEVIGGCSRGLLVEDGGDRLVATEPAGEGLAARYRDAARVILALQAHGRRRPPPNPGWALDGERLRDELGFTDRHALQGWLETPPSKGREGAFDRLAAAVAALPAVLCHRDYHSRNLLVTGSGLMVLDFQDAMSGPLFYDLASLLHDDYRDVPDSCATAALETFWEGAALPIEVSPLAEVPAEPALLPPGPRQALALIAAQRSLKALGTFGYQVGVASRHGYAAYAGRTWRHARRALAQLGWDDLVAELTAFDRLRAG